ncbi:MAG: type II toxin-antitoxin system RelE/ParE family toxin [Candidatus Aminicenantes bacterium]|nr:type II toxin-antitoxin system RelE/ParE family toxin [Candidatus Aminicenantes bacterium]
MNYFFHPEAKKELLEAINYYNECGSGLGYIFLEEVEATIDRVIKFPGTWSKLSKNTRQCLTRRFPYGIIYQEKDEGILIIAVMHLHREPGYWKKRVNHF